MYIFILILIADPHITQWKTESTELMFTNSMFCLFLHCMTTRPGISDLELYICLFFYFSPIQLEIS